MRIKRDPMVIWDQVDGLTALIHTGTGSYHRTNEVGRLIWEACEGRTVDEVARSVHETFPDADFAVIQRDVERYITSLHTANLLEWQED